MIARSFCKWSQPPSTQGPLVWKLSQPGNTVRDSDSFVVANVKTLFVILGVWWVLQIKQYLYGKLICVCSQESRAMAPLKVHGHEFKVRPVCVAVCFSLVRFSCTSGGGRELDLTNIVVSQKKSEQMREGQGHQ